MGELDEAEHYAQQALQQEEDTTQPYAMTVVGMVQKRREQWTQAEATLQFAVQAAVQIEDRYAEAVALRELGCVLQVQQKNTAPEMFSRAVALFTEMGLTQETDKTRTLLT